MQVEVEQALPFERDLVQPGVQARERPRVPGEPATAAGQVREHRRPVHELEDEAVVAHLEYLRDGKAVCPRVLHHRCFARRVAVPLEAAENSAVAEVDDLRGAPGGDHTHSRSLAQARRGAKARLAV